MIFHYNIDSIEPYDNGAYEMACHVMGFYSWMGNKAEGIVNGGLSKNGLLSILETKGFFCPRFDRDRELTFDLFFKSKYTNWGIEPFMFKFVNEFEVAIKSIAEVVWDYFNGRDVLQKGHYLNNFWGEKYGRDAIEFALNLERDSQSKLDSNDFLGQLKQVGDLCKWHQQLRYFDSVFTTEMEMVERFTPYLNILIGIFERMLKAFNDEEEREEKEKDKLLKSIRAEERYKRKLWRCKAKSALRSKVTSKDTMSFFSNLELISK